MHGLDLEWDELNSVGLAASKSTGTQKADKGRWGRARESEGVRHVENDEQSGGSA
jgi:hypothetical protein